MTLRKRISIIVLAGLAVLGGGAACLFFQFVRPIGSGPAGPAVGRELFSSAWTDRRVLFVGLGDSVTAGFGARKGFSYFDRLAANPANDFPEMKGICLASVFPKFQSTNLAVSGSTSSEVPSRQLHALPTNAPDVFGVVVMTTGGNDIIHNYGRTPPREEAMYGASMEEARPWVENFGRRLSSTIGQMKVQMLRCGTVNGGIVGVENCHRIFPRRQTGALCVAKPVRRIKNVRDINFAAAGETIFYLSNRGT